MTSEQNTICHLSVGGPFVKQIVTHYDRCLLACLPACLQYSTDNWRL